MNQSLERKRRVINATRSATRLNSPKSSKGRAGAESWWPMNVTDKTGGPVVANNADGAAASGIAGLLTEQRDLYLQLSRLTEKQRGLITGDEPERLLSLLAERQRLVDKLQAISRHLRPYQANWRQYREEMPDNEGRRVDGLVGEINALLGEIMRQDDTDTALLMVRKSETHRAIGTVQTGRQADRAYMASSDSQQQGMEWA